MKKELLRRAILSAYAERGLAMPDLPEGELSVDRCADLMRAAGIEALDYGPGRIVLSKFGIAAVLVNYRQPGLSVAGVGTE